VLRRLLAAVLSAGIVLSGAAPVMAADSAGAAVVDGKKQAKAAKKGKSKKGKKAAKKKAPGKGKPSKKTVKKPRKVS